ncbi:helix-turn-helix domain-containing protein [Corynebacterium antarcticum]|uniref:helix-turn-helix domain-containing protein n=1 Tax=Corynebacterium TaxID=1716 RepID=UPI003969ECCB
MAHFLVSLDELDRVKKMHRIRKVTELAERTNVARSTWTRVIQTRRPTPAVLDALAELGARPHKILVSDEVAA